MQENFKQVKLIGRFIEPFSKKAVNVYKGSNPGDQRGKLFWYFNSKRVIITQMDFFDKWKKTT